MTYNEKFVLFHRNVELNLQYSQRKGQAAWNAAMLVDPTIVELTDTLFDPYYHDDRLNAFIEAVTLRWRDQPENV